MASRTSTPSRSRSASTSTASSDTTMLDAPPLTPIQPRPASHGAPSPTATRTSAKDPTFSLLLSLPRELRDRIYHYALTSPFPFWWPNPAPMKHNVAMGLLTASRSVYEEAAPILYAGNKFLFTHPSDCNVFRVVASPKYSVLISSVYFRIREKDLRLWTTYLGSKTQERSLKYDLPKLKSMWIFLRCGTVGAPGLLGQLGGPIAGLPPALAAQVHAVQHALGQQVQALQQQVQNLTQALGGGQQQQQVAAQPVQQPHNGNANANANANATATAIANTNTDAGSNNQVPPPPPPPPAMPFMAFAQGGFGQAHQHPHAQLPHHVHQHPPPGQPHTHGTQNNQNANPPPLAQHLAAQHNGQQHPPPPVPPHHHHGPFYASFLRWERELGLENLCLSLQETRPAETDVKVVCIMRLPKPEVQRLVRLYPEELSLQWDGDARTRFRRLHGVDVSLEISGFDVGGG